MIPPHDPVATALDPKVSSVRDIFEGLVYYSLVWAIPVAVTCGVAVSADFVGLPKSSSSWVIGASLLAGLLTALAIFWSFDSEAGQARSATIGRWARIYAFPFTFGAGVALGWYGTSSGKPAYRAAWSEKAAANACLQFPACRTLAASWADLPPPPDRR